MPRLRWITLVMPDGHLEHSGRERRALRTRPRLVEVMKRVIILSGIPGSGKTRYAQETRDIVRRAGDSLCRCEIVSADHHFIGGDGVYRFEPERLGEAHRSCFRLFVAYLQERVGWVHSRMTLVVDNTNIGVEEIAPYYLAAESYDWEVEIQVVGCALEEALARQVHGVPEATVREMHERLVSRTLPAWWKVVHVPAGYCDAANGRTVWATLESCIERGLLRLLDRAEQREARLQTLGFEPVDETQLERNRDDQERQRTLAHDSSTEKT